ncbi:MAG TPA: hypothetical protein VF932_16930 [Anaerolineae bacterium]
METTLKEINAVLGVTGSFVCASDGNMIAQAMPGLYEAGQLALAARVANQFFRALEASSQRAAEMDLIFGQQRLILKTFRGGILAILCTRTINLPLLNLTVNVAMKKIAAAIKAPKPAALPVDRPAPPTPATAPAPAVATPQPVPVEAPAAEAEGNPLFSELYLEARRVVEEARQRKLDLHVLESLAIWHLVSRAHSVLAPLNKRQIVLAGHSAQGDAIARLFEELGYKANQRFNAFYGSRRLNFSHPKFDLVADVYLDAFSMFHHFDLNGYVSEDDFALPATALLLSRLQMVEWSDAALRDICALLFECDLSVGNEKGKIDASQITRLCAEDWGWFKTVSINLERVTALAPTWLGPEDRTVVVERAQRLRQSIVNAPKSLRWQTRARLGESVRWYETPIVGNPSARPDMAIG